MHAGDDERREIIIRADQLPGLYANWARVTPTDDDFTLDFVRNDPIAPPPGRGFVVARIAVPPGALVRLIDVLGAAWQRYARRQVFGDE